MKVAILGIGNDMKADDGIGLLAAEKFEKTIKNDHETMLLNTNVPENFIGPIEKFAPDILMIFDAAQFEGAYGDIKVIESEEIIDFSISTHNTPLSIFFKALNMKASYLIGIQVKNTEFDGKISEEVISSLPQAVSLAKDLLDKHL